jgi:hypothetical protein
MSSIHNLTFREPSIMKYCYNKSQPDALLLKLIFDKELYMFRRDLLSIIRSRNTIYTAIGICHASYVDSLLARSGWNCSLSKINLRNSASHWLSLYIHTQCYLALLANCPAKTWVSFHLPIHHCYWCTSASLLAVHLKI